MVVTSKLDLRSRVYFSLPSLCPVVLALRIWSGAAAAGVDAEPNEIRSSDGSPHVRHVFDFNERERGNVEDVPRGWFPLRMPGFPRFARGMFDTKAGHDAAPSFYLSSEGRSVAYQYTGPNIRVRAGSTYRIEGFTRVDQMHYARACLSAAYVDDEGRILPGTMTRSPWIGPVQDPDAWQPWQFVLPPAPPRAHRISLIAWVLQDEHHRLHHADNEEPARLDVRAGAWFDDIRIETAPRAELSTSSRSNVLTMDRPRRLRVLYASDDPGAPTGEVSIRNAQGREMELHFVHPARDGAAETSEIPLDHLDAGLYSARFRAAADRSSSIAEEMRFAIVSPLPQTESTTKAYGIVLRLGERASASTELALIEQLGVQSIKVPVEIGGNARSYLTGGRTEQDRFLFDLVKRGYSLTGVLHSPDVPQASGSATARRTLMEWLALDQSTWNDALAGVVAPHTSIFRYWQLGPDETPAESPNDVLRLGIHHLLDGMRRFTTSPLLVLPLANPAQRDDVNDLVDRLSVKFDGQSSGAWARQVLETLAVPRQGRVQAFLSSLESTEYRRGSRLSAWMQRLISLRHDGASQVFVAQPWTTTESSGRPVVEPTEEFILLRTTAALIGDLSPGKTLTLGPGIECRVFDQADSSTLVLWDTEAPAQGRPHTLQLGQARYFIDPWGREKLLERDEDGRHVVVLTPMPVFVPGVERWLVDFTNSSLSIEPHRIESGTELVTHRLRIDYFGDRPLTGSITLDTPGSWEVTPREIKLNLQPRKAETRQVQIRYPHNEPAGEKTINARVTIAETGYRFDIPLTVVIDLSDIEVSGSAFVEGDMLILRHVVTNRSNSVVSFRGSAMAVERERQYRPFASLKPGESQTVEYRFSSGRALVGTRVRLSLTEMNDGRRNHTLEMVVP